MNVYSFVSQMNHFELLIATFRRQHCSLHQAMRLIVYVACWFAAIGAFQSLLFRLLDVVPSLVRFLVDQLLCFLIVGIQASGILRVIENYRDSRIEIPEAWIPTIKKHKSRQA